MIQRNQKKKVKHTLHKRQQAQLKKERKNKNVKCIFEYEYKH